MILDIQFSAVPATKNHLAHIACHVNGKYVGRLRNVDGKLKYRGTADAWHVSPSPRNNNFPLNDERSIEELIKDPHVLRFITKNAMNSVSLAEFTSD